MMVITDGGTGQKTISRIPKNSQVVREVMHALETLGLSFDMYATYDGDDRWTYQFDWRSPEAIAEASGQATGARSPRGADPLALPETPAIGAVPITESSPRIFTDEPVAEVRVGVPQVIDMDDHDAFLHECEAFVRDPRVPDFGGVMDTAEDHLLHFPHCALMMPHQHRKRPDLHWVEFREAGQ